MKLLDKPRTMYNSVQHNNNYVDFNLILSNSFFQFSSYVPYMILLNIS